MARNTDDIVRAEIYCNVTGLTMPLSQGFGHELPQALSELAEEAFDVWTPVLDHESALEEAGWHHDAETGEWTHPEQPDDVYDSAEETCDIEGIEPHEREVFEAWAVSDWLGRKLREHGERVTDLGGLDVWSRTTTGQGISMDWVIEKIAKELAG